jgi:hypothetical protein
MEIANKVKQPRNRKNSFRKIYSTYLYKENKKRRIKIDEAFLYHSLSGGFLLFFSPSLKEVSI